MPLQTITRWASLAEKIGGTYNIPRDLVLAVIAQESSGNPGACRPERGFWARYSVGIIRNIKATVSTLDDQWLTYPDLVSTSYGLMQVLYEVAIERGIVMGFPTELCIADIGINAGCVQLVHCLHLVNPLATFKNAGDADLRAALQHYNGGGNPNYASEVLVWRDKIRAANAT